MLTYIGEEAVDVIVIVFIIFEIVRNSISNFSYINAGHSIRGGSGALTKFRRPTCRCPCIHLALPSHKCRWPVLLRNAYTTVPCTRVYVHSFPSRLHEQIPCFEDCRNLENRDTQQMNYDLSLDDISHPKIYYWNHNISCYESISTRHYMFALPLI